MEAQDAAGENSPCSRTRRHLLEVGDKITTWFCTNRMGSSAQQEDKSFGEVMHGPGPSPGSSGSCDDSQPPAKNCYRLVMLGWVKRGLLMCGWVSYTLSSTEHKWMVGQLRVFPCLPAANYIVSSTKCWLMVISMWWHVTTHGVYRHLSSIMQALGSVIISTTNTHSWRTLCPPLLKRVNRNKHLCGRY